MDKRRSPFDLSAPLAAVVLLLGANLVGCGTQAANLPGPGHDGDGGEVDSSMSTTTGTIMGDGGLSTGVFGGDGATCFALGATCASAGDCCSGDCASGVCSYPACSSDGVACATNGDCCSQSCTSGKCAALNATCKTLGNQCTSSSDCCSGRCASGTCQASSFCGQGGDACSSAADCCAGTCAIASGATLGTCGSAPPSGAANCALADGMLCAGTSADGGTARTDAGLPICGGACCSRACAPWGPTGVLVCQPASGCHVVGDLCRADVDCCGSAGLPGGSQKPVTCDIAAGATVGVCRLPMGCKPDGDVCKLQTMSCNSSCDCCSGNCETMDTCKQDNVGVPRCAAATCVAAGQACASSANCCGGAPCVPNPVDGGSPPYVCAGQQCVAACGSCTNNADCCPGTTCELPTGGARGVCGPCGGGNGADAGTSDGGGPGVDDGGTPPPPPSDSGTTVPPPVDSGVVCGVYGQICQVDGDCCNGLPCLGNRCGVIVR